jgi:SEC-C motif-containing protein
VRRCPCGLLAGYDECCGRYHRGAAAPTPELLMRSRYSAFAMGDSAYLRRSWHPRTCPTEVEATGRWLRLELLESSGGLLDTEGEVRFRAHHDDGIVEERSRFVRDAGCWVYLGPV